MNKIMDEIVRLLREAEKAHTWGNIQLDLQDGHVSLIRQTSTHKIPDGVKNTRHDLTF